MYEEKKKTFAQALNNIFYLSLSQLPTPCVKGDLVTVQINKEDWLVGFEDFKNHLNGSITLHKGENLWSISSFAPKSANLRLL